MIVYIVIYEPYVEAWEIECVLPSEELAKAYIDRRYANGEKADSLRFTEYSLDAIDREWLNGNRKFWQVVIGDDGDAQEVCEYSGQPKEWQQGVYSSWHLQTMKFIAYVLADTKENALKIAMERYSVWATERIGIA